MAGAGDEHTQQANREAFKRWGLYPRMLVAPTERDMSIKLFGIKLPSPIFMAPTGVIDGNPTLNDLRPDSLRLVGMSGAHTLSSV